MQDEPASPEFPQRFPTRELLLAQALEACITAERRATGSAQAIIDQQPVWLRDDLQSMMNLAGSLDSAAASVSMSPEFRRAARARGTHRTHWSRRATASRRYRRCQRCPGRSEPRLTSRP